MELLDIYDKNRNLTGKTMERGGKYSKGEFHLSIHVCIFNTKNELLIQKRQPWKKGFPNLWDITVSGSSLSGETSIEAAEREILEEMGYKIDLSNERPFFTINSVTGFDDFYFVERQIDIENLVLQYEEVQSVKWANKDEVLQLVKEGNFIDYWSTDLFFDMRKHRGAYRIS